MGDELHPAVELLLARMKSHPEEFELQMETMWSHPMETGRWHDELALLGWYLTDAERALLYAKRRELVFENVKNRIISKLLRGVGNE